MMHTADSELTQIADDLDSPELRARLGFPLGGALKVEHRTECGKAWPSTFDEGGEVVGFGVVLDGTTHACFLGHRWSEVVAALYSLANDGMRKPPAFLRLDAGNRPDLIVCSPAAAAPEAGARQAAALGDGRKLSPDDLVDLEECVRALVSVAAFAPIAGKRRNRVRRGVRILVRQLEAARAA